jgi:thiamine kinase-like enzyme
MSSKNVCFSEKMEQTTDPQELYRTAKRTFDYFMRDAILCKDQRDSYLEKAAEALSTLRPLAEQLNSDQFSPYTGYRNEVQELERKLWKERSRDFRDARRQ